MATTGFGISPVGFTPDADDGFPNFLQWQEEGVNLGLPDADTVNTGLGIRATRGEGEFTNVITLTAEIDVEALGVPFPDTVTALNIGAGLTATQDEFGVVTITTDAPAEFAWREVDGDAVVVSADSGNGISMIGASPQVVTIEPGAILPGRCVLVEQAGAGSVTFAVQSGVDLVYRSAFQPSIAGLYGIISLIGRPDGSVLLCGDMTPA